MRKHHPWAPLNTQARRCTGRPRCGSFRTVSPTLSSLANVPNRAERRRQQRVEGGKYQIPRGIVYDEFVGELRPPSDRSFTELHVRYGVKKGLYVDW